MCRRALVALTYRLLSEVLVHKALSKLKDYCQATQVTDWRLHLAAMQFRSQRADYYDLSLIHISEPTRPY